MEPSVHTLRFILKSEYYERPVDCWVKWQAAEGDFQPELTNELRLTPLSQIEAVGELQVTAKSGSRVYFQFFEKTQFETLQFPYDSVLVNGQMNIPMEILETERCRSPDQSRTTIRFKMNYFTYFGQNIYVVGSTRALGFWDKKRALLLSHAGSVGPSSVGKNQIFSDRKYNWQGDMAVDCLPPSLSYKYFCTDGHTVTEEPFVRLVSLGGSGGFIELNDIWNWNVLSFPLFSTRFFSTVFARETQTEGRIMTSSGDTVRCYFRATVIGLGRDRNLRIVGSIPELGSWNESNGINLTRRERLLPQDYSSNEGLGWSLELQIPSWRFPFEYKFIAPSNLGLSSLWEISENRVASKSNMSSTTVSFDAWQINFPDLTFHGSSVFFQFSSIRCLTPLCSFDVIKNVGEWASRCGFSHVQVAGIFDKSAIAKKKLDFPVSGFALSPNHLSLSQYGFTGGSEDISSFLNDKLTFIEQKLFPAKRNEVLPELKKFMDNNAFWLVDYTKLCAAARITGSAETASSDVAVESSFAEFVAFVQYLCYKQIKEAVVFCKQLHIAVGLDLPFELSQFSAEARFRRYLFLQDFYLGAPPSKELPIGSLLSAFPYNFKEAITWIANRVSFFGRIFPALRLSSTVRYFRQWVIPRSRCIRAIFGHYEPSMSISSAELETWGLWDFDRYSRPYMNHEVMSQFFGHDQQAIENTFLYRLPDFTLAFKPEFNNEVLLTNAKLSGQAEALRNKYINSLLRLQGEVLLVRTHEGDGDFTPRAALNIAPDPAAGPSASFSALPPYEQAAILRLHDEFTLNKQRPLWASSGRWIMAHIKSATQSLLLSDASGYSGEICDDVIQKLCIVPLRVQTEGRGNNTFDDVRSYPFFSVASPACNSSPPLSYLWDNGKIECRKLWEEELWESGQAPVSFNGTVAATIMRQHCWSASMLTMFPLDTLMGSNNHIVRSEMSEYGALDIIGFLSDKPAEKEITDILEQTKRKN